MAGLKHGKHVLEGGERRQREDGFAFRHPRGTVECSVFSRSEERRIMGVDKELILEKPQ